MIYKVRENLSEGLGIMNNQNELSNFTKIIFKELNIPKIRAVTAFWKEKAACITFYYEGNLTEEEQELASVACGEIIANFSEGLLEENYIQLDLPKPIPDAKYIAYRRT